MLQTRDSVDDFAHCFIRRLRNAYFFFCSSDSLFGRLGNVLQERTCRLFELRLECHRRVSGFRAIPVDGRFTVRGFGRVDLHCILGRVTLLINVHVDHFGCIGLGTLCMGVVWSLSCRQALPQVNVSPNRCQEVCMEGCTRKSETPARETRTRTLALRVQFAHQLELAMQ